MSIRTRLTLWYASLLMIVIIAFSVLIFGGLRVSMLSTVDGGLEQTASRVIQSIRISAALTNDDTETDIAYRSTNVFQVPGYSIQVWANPPRIKPYLHQFSPDLVGFEGALHPVWVTVDEISFETMPINDVLARMTARPFYSPTGERVGVVQVATPIQTLEDTLNRWFIIIGIVCLASILVAIVLARWMSKRMVEPIEAMRVAASKVAVTEDLSTRLQWSGPSDEVGRLTQVFNHMMERLEDLFRVQQQFVGDVSHELRTPLTAIQGNLDIIERYGMDDGAALQAIRAESNRMTRMVEDLLLLTRVDTGAIKLDMFPFELDRLVVEVYEHSHILMRDRNLRLTLGEVESVWIHGNADRMRQLLLNLIRNAIKFTPDGGSITLRLSVNPQKPSEVVLEVVDTGIGISVDDQAHIFDRFYQVDSSRARHNNDGVGLGLSISYWVAKVHNGRITVDSTVGEGATFRVHLPIQKVPQRKFRQGSVHTTT